MTNKQIQSMPPSARMGMGVALGVALDNLALGIAIGVAVGTALGAAFSQQADRKDGKDQHGGA